MSYTLLSFQSITICWKDCTGLSNTFVAFPQLRHAKTGRENEARAKGADVERMRKGSVGGTGH